MSRHHKFPRMDKERDYALTESRCFFGDLDLFLSSLALEARAPWPSEAQALLQEIIGLVKTHDTRHFDGVHEKARQYAWKTHKTLFENVGATLLSLTQFLMNFQTALAKEPADYDRSLRPEDLR